jgi:hypothetical protein
MTTKTVTIDGKEVTVSKIVSIQDSGTHTTYDIEVEGHHNFFAEGINVHNCQYHSMLKYYCDKYNERLFKFNETYVAYPCRGLIVYPAGPDTRVLRGRTRFGTSVDEIGWFDASRDTKKVKDNAYGVFDALSRSLLTLRGAAERLIRLGYDNVYTGMDWNVSSPSHRNDMIMSLVRSAEESEVMYGVHRPTWEVNPYLPKTSSAIKEAYRKDPITAERDFGAVPPLAASPFLTNHALIAACFRLKRNNSNIKSTIIQSKKRGESFTYANVMKIRKVKHPTILTLDAGFTNNSFSGTVTRIREDDGKLILVTAFEIIPQPGAPLRHSAIFDDVIQEIIEKQNVKVLIADRWNSIKLLQDAEDLNDGLEAADQYSMKYKDFFHIKTLIERGDLLLPKLEGDVAFDDILNIDSESYPHIFEGKPMQHLGFQMATVKDTVKTVDKGDGYTDDTFRALALAAWAHAQEKYQIILSESDDLIERSGGPGAIGASRLYSGGGGTVGTAGGSGTHQTLGVYTSMKR